jgi:hypothetical protein
MKDQLIEKLHELVSADDIMLVREGVREIRNDWKAETAKERQQQQEEWKQAQAPEGEKTEFVYTAHPLEEKYQELLKKYEDRIEEAGKILAAERQKNFEQKSEILAELEKLVTEEQNVGKAFAAHKALKEKWDQTGDVPGDKYADLQDRWSKWNHQFYYNIDIYKSLQEHDLKINQRKKEEMIREAGNLASIESINELEVLVRKYQREWVNIGPSPRETYKELGDTFFGILRESQNKIQAYYDALNANSEENLGKKKALVEKMKEVLNMEITNASTWNRWTDEVLKLQEEWKTIGWARKKENEEVWQEFRGLCDLFFTRRKNFNDQKKLVFKEHKDKKEVLIAKAKELQDSSDWKLATESLKKLQEEWKTIGSADPRDEQKLWQRFRSACDHFFNRKKEHFGGVADQQEENLRLKEALLQEIESAQMTGNKGDDLALLKDYSNRWHAIGFVPREKIKEIADRYNKALDNHYGKINADREERELNAFKSRIESIRQGTESDYAVRKEKNVLRDKLERLQAQIKQYENNMGFFTGKGAEAMRKEIEKKIKSTEREIEDLKKKMQMLNS